MPFVKIASRLVNTDTIAHVATGVHAQPPGKPPVDDAVRIHFVGATAPLDLFGDEATAAVAVLSPAAPVAKPEPAPAPAPKPEPTPAKPAPATPTPTPAPAKP